jgi:hypothetical protein
VSLVFEAQHLQPLWDLRSRLSYFDIALQYVALFTFWRVNTSGTRAIPQRQPTPPLRLSPWRYGAADLD